jgi:type VI secretion system protein ImpF
MATPARRMNIVPSVLDRLLDDAPQEAHDPSSTLSQDLELYKAQVRRDLEAMLNTRQESPGDLSGYPELQRSLLTYGLPDFTTFSLQSDTDRVRMREAIETAIRHFEPRIMEAVVVVEAPDQKNQQLAFRVEGYLRVDPVPAPVAFDAVLQLSTQQYQIRG